MTKMAMLIACGCMLSIGQAKDIFVDDDAPADFNSIAAAVEAAASGDTLILREGVYRGSGNRGIQLRGKALTLRGEAGASRTLIDCQAKDGAFYLSYDGDALSLEGLTLCNGVRSQGGALFAYSGSISVTGCTFYGNVATSGDGGAIYVDGQGQCAISRCQFIQNWASGSGGAVCGNYQCTLSAMDSLFYANVSLSQGGAFYAGYYSTLAMSGCTFVSNAAKSEGGALALYETQSTLVNCSLLNNAAVYQGGGIFCWYTYPMLTHCTLSANTASEGDALFLYYGTQLEMTNCIVSGHDHTAIWDYNWSSTGKQASFRNCLFYANKAGIYRYEQDSITYPTAGAINQIQGCTGNQEGNPGFAFADDAHLTAASKAIDKGTTSGSRQMPTTDAAGRARVVDGDRDGLAVADMGAFEFDPSQMLLAASEPVLQFTREQAGPNPQARTLQVRNLGPGTSDWTIQTETPWLAASPRVVPVAGEPVAVQISVNTEGLPRGLYMGSLTLTSSQAQVQPLSIPVLLQIKGELHVPADFATLSVAAAAAWDGETIHVAAGTYTEYIRLSRSVALIGHGRPILQGTLELTGDGCTVQGFQISSPSSTGLYVNSSGNTLIDNEITGCTDGMVLLGTGNTVTGNRITQNLGTGLRISGGSNTLSNNQMEGNATNFDPAGATQSDYVQQIDNTNTIEGLPLVYLVGQADGTIEGEAGCVVLVNCTNMAVQGVDVAANGKGVTLVNCTFSLIRDCVVHDNPGTGVWIEGGRDITLLDNQVSGNTYGIRLRDSTGVAMEANTFVRNRYHFTCEGGDYRHQIDTTNTLDGRPLVYLLDATNAVVDGSSQAACVYAVNCTGITIKDLQVSGNGHGVLLYGTKTSLVQRVTAEGTGLCGIEMTNCTGVQVLDCKAFSNPVGMRIMGGQQDRISRCTIAQNQRGLEGYGSPQIDDSIIRDNSPNGGLYFSGASGLNLYNCTILNNRYRPGYNPSKEQGGGIMGYGGGQSSRINNCILWGNSPGQVPTYSGFTVATSDVEGGFAGQGNKDASPMLTADGHLRLGSPCIGAGRSSSGQPISDIDEEPGNRSGSTLDLGADQYYDYDRDGLPNKFERLLVTDGMSANPADDPDHDGLTNLQEYEIYSSNPAVPAAVLHVDAATGDDLADGLSAATAKKTIGAALAQSTNSDRIIVHPGTYPEDVTFAGRQVVLQGIDPKDPQVVRSSMILGQVTLTGSEGRGCVLQGLTISGPREAVSYSYSGVPRAVVQCEGSSPTIADCVIVPNRQVPVDGYWCGLVCAYGSPRVDGCAITGHRAVYAAVYAVDSTLDIEHTAIAGNQAYYNGTAIYAERSTLQMSQCTLAENRYPSAYGENGVSLYAVDSVVRISNSILWDGAQSEIQAMGSTSITLNYCDVRRGSKGIVGTWSGQGNVAVDPCFVQTGHWDGIGGFFSPWITGDYHLQSQGWQWMETAGGGSGWTRTDRTSLCLEAGNPGTPLADEPRFADIDPNRLFGQNLRVELGAYGGTRQASVAPLGWGLWPDMNNDGIVEGTDLALFGTAFGSADQGCPADLDRNGAVNSLDLAILSQQWLSIAPWTAAMVIVP